MNLRSAADQVRRLSRATAKDQQLATMIVKYVLVLGGALLAGFAQFMETPEEGVAWNRVIGMLGVALAFVGGFWHNLSDRHAPEALDAAGAAMKLAQESTERSSAFLRLARDDLDSLREEHRQLRQLLALSNILREGVEGVLLSPKHDTKEDLRQLLLGAYRSLLAVLRADASERWTITIYKDENGVLEGMTACTVDRGEENAPIRAWGSGEGFAGAAFSRGREIVLANARDRAVLSVLNVPPEKVKPGDYARYASVASIPIRISDQKSPWGVVIATSDKEGRFDPSKTGPGAISADAVRLLAGMLALFVAANGEDSRLVAMPERSVK